MDVPAFTHPALDRIISVSTAVDSIVEKFERLRRRVAVPLAEAIAVDLWRRTGTASPSRLQFLAKKISLNANSLVYECSGQAEVLLRRLMELDSVTFDDVEAPEHRSIIRTARKAEVSRINAAISFSDRLTALAKGCRSRVEALLARCLLSEHPSPHQDVPVSAYIHQQTASPSNSMEDDGGAPELATPSPSQHPTPVVVTEESDDSASGFEDKHMDSEEARPPNPVTPHLTPSSIKRPITDDDWHALFPSTFLAPSISPVVKPADLCHRPNLNRRPVSVSHAAARRQPNTASKRQSVRGMPSRTAPVKQRRQSNIQVPDSPFIGFPNMMWW